LTIPTHQKPPHRRSPVHPYRPPSTCFRDAGGYGIYPILEVSLGEFVGRVWRHVSRDADASWTEYDCTIDGLSTAGSAGIEDPQQLRDLASVADELAALRAPIDAAMDRHPAGNGRVVGK
jgi:hypothetical protein